ncbi:MAG: RNA polymerase factor sigma-54 [Candidatus Sumerlaeaceae bacterium]|nr:RNA polymerase factor sigma-54 [Candidatus Sumerlaeaceae bacterium]
MALSLHQEQRLRQEHRLVMTQQMQQSIKLLQMSAMELEQLATTEMLENPFLEIAEEGEAGEEETSEEPSAEDDATEENAAESPEDQPTDLSPAAEIEQFEVVANPDYVQEPSAPESVEHFDDVDVNWDEYYDGAENVVYAHHDSSEEERDFTEYTSAPQSLYSSLKWQLGVAPISDEQRRIGEYIIGNIDDDGYLRVPLAELAGDLGCTVEQVEQVLAVVQTFEPVGVGARDLAECLRIQLRARGVKDPLAYKILTHHFDLLQKKKFRELARELKVDVARIHEIFQMVSQLEPKPGKARSGEQVRYIVPDVIVKKVDDKYMIFLNEGRTAGLRINRYYQSLLLEGAIGDGKEKEFAQEKYRNAVWLMKNIEKRKSTILKVCEAIMNFQRDFLEKGTRYLRPLTLKEIAEVVEMHESTVARVTSGKYIETPRGIFELKYFFSPGLEMDSGEEASSTAIKDLLRQLVDSEDPRHPLSDQKLAEMIQARGINIARRTVAKYREQLKILPAKLRRQVQ